MSQITVEMLNNQLQKSKRAVENRDVFTNPIEVVTALKELQNSLSQLAQFVIQLQEDCK